MPITIDDIYETESQQRVNYDFANNCIRIMVFFMIRMMTIITIIIMIMTKTRIMIIMMMVKLRIKTILAAMRKVIVISITVMEGG